MKFVILILAALVPVTSAQEVVIRDSIGPDSSWTDGCANYANRRDPNGYGFLVANLVSPQQGTLTGFELVVVDAHALEPTNPESYTWHVSIWQDESGVQEFPLGGDKLSAELSADEVDTELLGLATHPVLGSRATYKIQADLSAYSIHLIANEDFFVALYPLSLTQPFAEGVNGCESAESTLSTDLYRLPAGAFPLAEGTENQFTGRAAVRATIIASGAVPAVSTWGIGILALLTLAMGTLAFRRATA